MKKTYLLPLVALTHAASAATFVIGDGFAADGSGSFGVDPLDNPYSSPGNSGRDSSINTPETSSLYDLTTGGFATSPFSSSEPIVAGQISFGSGNIFQGGVSFDLSMLPSAGAVTAIELFLEVTASTFNNGIENSGDSVRIDAYPGLLPGDPLPLTSGDNITLNNSQEAAIERTFISFSFNPSLIDLSTDSVFNVVLDAGSSPTTAAIFGSGLAPNNGLDGGTSSVTVSPALRITTVPEPSTFVLSALAGLGVIVRRRR